MRLPQEYFEWGRQTVNKLNTKHRSTLVISPISASAGKDLLDFQLEGIIRHAHKKGLFVLAVHENTIPRLVALNVPVVSGTSIPQWMGVINAADYVLSVDTAAVHYAGSIGKPTVGVFTYADGKIYGKYLPRFELVQLDRDNGGKPECPCYNWTLCPYAEGIIKPCLTEISAKMLTDALDRLLEKYSN